MCKLLLSCFYLLTLHAWLIYFFIFLIFFSVCLFFLFYFFFIFHVNLFIYFAIFLAYGGITRLRIPEVEEGRMQDFLSYGDIGWDGWVSFKFLYIFLCMSHSIRRDLEIWCFEHSGDISCSLLVNPSHTDESWERRNTCLWIYIYIYKWLLCWVCLY